MTALRLARAARGWSQARVIYELQRHALATGVAVATPASLKTQLSRWENGHRLPDALYRELFRAVYGLSDDELGFTATADTTGDTGLAFGDTWSDGVDVAAELWQGDMDRRDFLRNSVFTAAAFGSPVLRWLVSDAEETPRRESGRLTIGQPHVDSIRAMTTAFRGLDNQHGGGHVRESAVRYLNDEVEPMLRDGKFSPTIGAALFAATAEMTRLAGWMSYDCGQHGLSQRYLIQALRLAKAADDRALGAEILAAMSHQATYLGDGADAVDLARASGRTASEAGVRALVAEAAVAEAHGQARRKDGKACASALVRAEQALHRADRTDDPQWISYFDEAYLSAKFGHCFRELGQVKQAQRFARRSLDMDGSFVRGRAFNLSLLASSLAQQGEVEEACAVGQQAVALTRPLSSARAVGYLSDVLKDLQPYSGYVGVRELYAAARPLVASAG